METVIIDGIEEDDSYTRDIRVKDIIKFLQQFDPETLVELDKDGWEAYPEGLSNNDVIARIIDDSYIKYGGGDCLIINN